MTDASSWYLVFLCTVLISVASGMHANACVVCQLLSSVCSNVYCYAIIHCVFLVCSVCLFVVTANPPKLLHVRQEVLHVTYTHLTRSTTCSGSARSSSAMRYAYVNPKYEQLVLLRLLFDSALFFRRSSNLTHPHGIALSKLMRSSHQLPLFKGVCYVCIWS